MAVHSKLTTFGEGWENLVLQVVPLPVLVGVFLEDEEARVDPVVVDQRFLLEPLNLQLLVKHDQSVLRAQRYGGERRQAAVLLMPLQQAVQVDVTQAVPVGGQETIPHVGAATQDAVAGVGVVPGIHDANLPVGKAAAEIIEEDFLTMPGGQDEIVETLCGEDAH